MNVSDVRRGTCPVCGNERIQVLVSGLLRWHPDPNRSFYSAQKCAGSYGEPLDRDGVDVAEAILDEVLGPKETP